jgi:hypothetical protein
MKVNPFTILEGIDGLGEILASEQPAGLLGELVAYDANRSLDDASDVGARQWLEQLLGRLRAWVDSAPAG